MSENKRISGDIIDFIEQTGDAYKNMVKIHMKNGDVINIEAIQQGNYDPMIKVTTDYKNKYL